MRAHTHTHTHTQLLLACLTCLLAHCPGEEKLNRAIDEIRAMEEEKLNNAVAEEKRRADELESNLQQLRQVGCDCEAGRV